MPPASMEASAAVETSTSVGASAKARLATGGKASGDPSVIETAERSRVGAGLAVLCRKSMLATGKSSRRSAVKSA